MDEIAIRKGHEYRVVVSDLERQRPIWFGGAGRKQEDLAQFFTAYGSRRCAGIRVAVMDMWKPFRQATHEHAPQAQIVFDKFHILRHLNEALDDVRRAEYARVQGKQRRFIKGNRYTLLSHRENLDLDGRQALKTLLAANRRLNTAYLLKESFGQLWSYQSEAWARKFFENWKDALKWQRLKAVREVRADDRTSLGGHRFLLPAREQSRARLRRGAEQHDSRHSAQGLWLPR